MSPEAALVAEITEEVLTKMAALDLKVNTMWIEREVERQLDGDAPSSYLGIQVASVISHHN